MNPKIKLYSILKLKCPRCNCGGLFTNPGLFVTREFLKMHGRCRKCSQDFWIEPDFYSTSLWIGFPIALTVCVPLLFLGLYLSDQYQISLKLVVPVFLIVCLVLQIPVARISRTVLLHLAFTYFGGSKKQ